jgi:hypothetical protein
VLGRARRPVRWLTPARVLCRCADRSSLLRVHARHLTPALALGRGAPSSGDGERGSRATRRRHTRRRRRRHLLRGPAVPVPWVRAVAFEAATRHPPRGRASHALRSSTPHHGRRRRRHDQGAGLRREALALHGAAHRHRHARDQEARNARRVRRTLRDAEHAAAVVHGTARRQRRRAA